MRISPNLKKEHIYPRMPESTKENYPLGSTEDYKKSLEKKNMEISKLREHLGLIQEEIKEKRNEFRKSPKKKTIFDKTTARSLCATLHGETHTRSKSQSINCYDIFKG